MQAFTLLAVLLFCGFASASDERLSEDCLRGVTDRNKCCSGVPDAWYAHLRNPEDCASFYQCEHGKPTWKACAEGTHWSVEADRCEWPHEAKCTVDPQPQPPTENTPTGSTSGPKLPSGCYDGSIDAKTCCVGISDWWVHLPDPENCGKFYQCDNGKAVHKDCPAGLHWSVAEDKCEWPDKAGCNSGGNTTPTTTMHPTPTIPDNTTPGSSTPNGGSKLPEGCYDGSIDAKTCCEGVSDWWVHLPDPENCGKFYQCDNGKAVLKDCPAGLHWSVAADRCEWPEIAGCVGNNPTTPSSTASPVTTTQPPSTRPPPTDTTTSNPPTTTPGDGNDDDECAPEPVCHQCITGIFPADLCCRDVKTYHKLELADGNNCSSYYQCVNGHAVQRQCPAGLHWSVDSDRCEHPADAQCSANGDGGNNGGNDGGNNGNEGGDGGNDGGNGGAVSNDCLSGKISAEECCRNVPYWVDVLLQNNADCHTYLQCVHGKPMVRPCPANLWWSITRNRCEWKENATCTW